MHRYCEQVCSSSVFFHLQIKLSFPLPTVPVKPALGNLVFLCVSVWAHALLTPETYCNRRPMFPEEIAISALNVSQSDLASWSQDNLTIVSTRTFSYCYAVVMGNIWMSECLPTQSHVVAQQRGTRIHKLTAPSLLLMSASSSSEATSTSERSVQAEWLCWSRIRSGGWWWEQWWWSSGWRRWPRFRIWPKSRWPLTYYMMKFLADVGEHSAAKTHYYYSSALPNILSFSFFFADTVQIDSSAVNTKTLKIEVVQITPTAIWLISCVFPREGERKQRMANSRLGMATKSHTQ